MTATLFSPRSTVELEPVRPTHILPPQVGAEEKKPVVVDALGRPLAVTTRVGETNMVASKVSLDIPIGDTKKETFFKRP